MLNVRGQGNPIHNLKQTGNIKPSLRYEGIDTCDKPSL